MFVAFIFNVFISAFDSRDFIHSFINGSRALCWDLAAFSVLRYYIQSVDSLDGILARREAATYTQGRENRKNTH
jgi:hypothetical protein